MTAKITDAEVEAVWDALAERNGCRERCPEPHEDCTCRNDAVAALAVSRAHLAAQGYVIVPLEPTEEMLVAAAETDGMKEVNNIIVLGYGHRWILSDACLMPNTPLQQAWRAMVAAALPAPPAGEPEREP